jgi:disulfide bond formation protein DsbB
MRIYSIGLPLDCGPGYNRAPVLCQNSQLFLRLNVCLLPIKVYFMLPSPRMLSLAIFLFAAGALLAGIFIEHQFELEPCSMCVFQRVMFMGVGLVALAAAIQNPGRLGRQIYAVLVLIFADLGAALAVRQLWLQQLPPDQVPTCPPSLDYMLEVLPFTEVLKVVLSGDGNCAEVAWSMLGLSIPGWSLVCFVVIVSAGMIQLVRR